MAWEYAVVYHPIPTSSHNRKGFRCRQYLVVYHPIPTSSHNVQSSSLFLLFVVYHPIPTSSHNSPEGNYINATLYIILFLHQATTMMQRLKRRQQLYIILFLHQATTSLCIILVVLRCISSYSYIKPQRSCIIYCISSIYIYYIA